VQVQSRKDRKAHAADKMQSNPSSISFGKGTTG